MRDKVKRQCPHKPQHLMRKESRSGFEPKSVPLLTNLTPYRKAKLALIPQTRDTTTLLLYIYTLPLTRLSCPFTSGVGLLAAQTLPSLWQLAGKPRSPHNQFEEGRLVRGTATSRGSDRVPATLSVTLLLLGGVEWK